MKVWPLMPRRRRTTWRSSARSYRASDALAQQAQKPEPAHTRWPWCVGHALNNCGWRVDPKGWIWCEECYADYLSDPDAYK